MSILIILQVLTGHRHKKRTVKSENGSRFGGFLVCQPDPECKDRNLQFFSGDGVLKPYTEVVSDLISGLVFCLAGSIEKKV